MTKNNFTIFDQYLAGEMTEVEKRAFEARLNSSEELYSEFMAFKIAVEAMIELPQYAEAAELTKKLNAGLEVDYHQQFKQYESKTLNAEQRQAFEKRLQEDAYFAYRYQKFQQERQAIPNKDNQNARIIPMRKVLRYAVAAAVSLLLFFFGRSFFGTKVDTRALYVQYDLDTLYPEARFALVNEGIFHKGIIDSKDFVELKQKGLEAYEAKDWDATIDLLSEYLRQAKPSEEEMPDEINLINLYTGRAWMEKGELSKALKALKKADEGVVDLANYSLMQELIRWQLVLAYLKNNNPKSAKKVLVLLRNAEDEVIRQQSINLLNDLE